jgi:molecular chaperone GrpE
MQSETNHATAEKAAMQDARERSQINSAPAGEAQQREEGIEQFDAASVEGPAAQIERLEAEKSDLTDRLLRLAADMDNLRRRTERDVADARKYAVAKFAGDMLVVGDNLHRALDAYPPDKREGADEVVKAFIEGVEMTGREMDRLLEKNGIVRIAADGERFDPHRHQAMFEVPNPEIPPEPSCRSCSRAIRSATVCSARPWLGSPPAVRSLNRLRAEGRDRRRYESGGDRITIKLSQAVHSALAVGSDLQVGECRATSSGQC